MVGVAQLVRAPGCGPGGRGFKSHHSPKYISGYSVVRLTRLLWEQEIGSSNLSTPTLEKYQDSLDKSPVIRWGFLFHIYSFFIINTHKWDTKKWDTPTYTHTCGVFCFWGDGYILINTNLNICT